MWQLKKIHQVGELIAAVAVVISLVFVGYEVQQNNQAQTRIATEAVVRDFVTAIRTLSEDAEMACIYSLGIQDFQSLSGSERLRLSAYLLGVHYAVQEMHSLAQQGSIVPGVWNGFEQLAKDSIQLPGARQWFATRRNWFSPEYQQYIDEALQNPSPTELVFYDDPACARKN